MTYTILAQAVRDHFFQEHLSATDETEKQDLLNKAVDWCLEALNDPKYGSQKTKIVA